MTHHQRALALEAARSKLAELRQEAKTLPMSSGSRRAAYIYSLDAAYLSLGAAVMANASDKEAAKE